MPGRWRQHVRSVHLTNRQVASKRTHMHAVLRTMILAALICYHIVRLVAYTRHTTVRTIISEPIGLRFLSAGPEKAIRCCRWFDRSSCLVQTPSPLGGSWGLSEGPFSFKGAPINPMTVSGGNRGTTFAAVQTFANSLGPITTLDEARILQISDSWSHGLRLGWQSGAQIAGGCRTSVQDARPKAAILWFYMAST